MREEERKYIKKIVAHTKAPKKTTTRVTPKDLNYWKKKTYSTPDGKQIIETGQSQDGVNIAE